jgi:hypothetical protein
MGGFSEATKQSLPKRLALNAFQASITAHIMTPPASLLQLSWAGRRSGMTL